MTTRDKRLAQEIGPSENALELPVAGKMATCFRGGFSMKAFVLPEGRSFPHEK